jgi:hypothetical protein
MSEDIPATYRGVFGVTQELTCELAIIGPPDDECVRLGQIMLAHLGTPINDNDLFAFGEPVVRQSTTEKDGAHIIITLMFTPTKATVDPLYGVEQANVCAWLDGLLLRMVGAIHPTPHPPDDIFPTTEDTD